MRRPHYLAIAYLIVASVLAIVTYRLETTAKDTNKIVKSEIPRLEAELAERDKTIADLNYVLNQQAVPAIIDMGKILRANGINPPNVLLNPSEPPYKNP